MAIELSMRVKCDGCGKSEESKVKDAQQYFQGCDVSNLPSGWASVSILTQQDAAKDELANKQRRHGDTEYHNSRVGFIWCTSCLIAKLAAKGSSHV